MSKPHKKGHGMYSIIYLQLLVKNQFIAAFTISEALNGIIRGKFLFQKIYFGEVYGQLLFFSCIIYIRNEVQKKKKIRTTCFFPSMAFDDFNPKMTLISASQ